MAKQSPASFQRHHASQRITQEETEGDTAAFIFLPGVPDEFTPKRRTPRHMMRRFGWPDQIEPANRNRNVRKKRAQHERHDGLCEIWQSWYNGCMNADYVRRRARSEKSFLIDFQSPVSTCKMQAERGAERFCEKESSYV